MADDLEQVMREMFKVKICERVGSGFLSAVERGGRGEGFSWDSLPKTHIHTLAMAEALGFDGKEELQGEVACLSGPREDKPEAQCATKESARFTCGEVHAQTVVQV